MIHLLNCWKAFCIGYVQCNSVHNRYVQLKEYRSLFLRGAYFGFKVVFEIVKYILNVTFRSNSSRERKKDRHRERVVERVNMTCELFNNLHTLLHCRCYRDRTGFSTNY
jgi:hypothetical protein